MHRRIVCLLIVAVALVLAPAALARRTKVVPFKTVAGVPLKLTPAQVRHRLGRPSRVGRLSGKVAEYDYLRWGLSVRFDTFHHPIRADFVGVTSGEFAPHIRFRTVHGIHIGSTRRAVRRAFGKRCHWEVGNCVIWKGPPGAVGSTSFTVGLFQGKVQDFDNQYVFKDF